MAPAVLITGACGGIGTALCKGFAGAGYFVVGTDLADQADVGHAYFPCDLSELPRSEAAQTAFLEAVTIAVGEHPLTTCINNAAVQILNPTADIADEDFDRTFRVNVFAPFVITRLLLPMLQRAKGSVINIGSIHATATKPGFVSYATSKAAMRGLTSALAVDLGGDVRVNAIEPAAIETDMLLAGFANNPAGYHDLCNFHPSGAIGQPDEVAKLACFLASEQCPFLTGSIIGLDGGNRGRLHDPE
jgi:NAD(P)-dependent dehydrogenase (short-subunit alcohol dehydrogenase family)